MASQTNIRNVIRIADRIETTSPQAARKLRQVLRHHANDREIAAEIFRQRRATRRANNQARG